MERYNQLHHLMTELNQKHSVTQGVPDLKKIFSRSCMPKYGVEDFLYSATLLDGRRTYLASSETIRTAVLTYIAHQKNNASGFQTMETMHMNLHGQIILWDSSEVTNVIHAVDRFYLMTYFQKFSQGTEIFFFTFTNEDVFSRYSYHDICSSIKKFVSFFHDNAKSLIRKSHQEFFSLPNPDIYIDQFFSSATTTIPNLPHDPLFSNLLSSNKRKFYISDKTHLTRKELVVMAHLINGYTAKEVANIMHLSEETIKTHYKHVKQKLGTKTAFQTGARLRMLLLQPNSSGKVN